MKEITVTEAAQDLSRQLESKLSRLALAADSNISTWSLESEAKKLAGKLKVFAEQLGNYKIYQEVEGSNISYPEDKLSNTLFPIYAKLCKQCGDQMKVKEEDNKNYVEIVKGVFVCLEDFPTVEMPTFKVKVENGTLIAVRADLANKLSADMQKLIGKGGNE